ncbi:Ras family protein [Sporothrix brasiliensis 5110]|uniref:Ras family protein n=1 Tax=Sporothrix brasiliensis 5110 TaxID=1398154 RepID=A0A0C2FUX3_9PEZI|nr:Ras family protein [Sporothrix brasiliensis 5110]KIH94828.1 Ras family protein [Sporothrix brasiliensis 5110]
MTRPRGSSAASEDSSGTAHDQELGSMYDYLAKIILLGPSGSGKSCLLHRFVKNEWRVLSSQTIGVEFSSKIIKVGSGARRKRIKLQLWDTAGTERFRSVSRSYYRGAAGAILVYDVTAHRSFAALPPFLNDARALASPHLTTLLVGNKLDLAADLAADLIDVADSRPAAPTSSSASYLSSSPSASILGTSVATVATTAASIPASSASASASASTAAAAAPGLGAQLKASVAPDGREVSTAEAGRWATSVHVPVALEVSALSGEGVDEVFGRMARMILTKIELGEIDPDDPMSGIQYGDAGASWNAGASDGGSTRSYSMAGGGGVDDASGSGGGGPRRRRNGTVLGGGRKAKRGGGMALREWEEVFALPSRRRGGACGC